MSLFRVIRRAGFLISIAILIFAATNALAANASTSPAQLALYQGPDREKIILEGARKEGQLVFYNSHTWFKSVAQEFEKKYPFVKVSEWRAEGPDVPQKSIGRKRARDGTWPMLLRARKPTSQVCTRKSSSRNITLLRSAFTMVKYWPKASAVFITGPTASFILVSVSTRISFLPPRPPRACYVDVKPFYT